MDGETARRHDVSLTYANKLLIISDNEGRCLSTWEVGMIASLDQISPQQPFLLSCSSKGNARLKIEGEATKVWLFNMLPGLARRNEYKKENQLAIRLSICVVALSLLAYFTLPLMTDYVVRFIPESWERETFKGSGIEIAKQFGAKAICTDEQGQELLQGLVGRLIGDDKAKFVFVRVVDHKMVNAFATPGREIIVMRGLIDKAKTVDEVVGVLAHELGHVEERHPMEATVRGAGLIFVISLFSGGDFADFAGLLAQTSYSRDHERDADRFALDVLKKANIRTDGLADFFEKLDKENHKFEKVMQLISTHPMSNERAEMMRAYKGGEVALSALNWTQLKKICSQQKKL